MANILRHEKQLAVLSMLLEGGAVRSVSRLTGVHVRTILALLVRMGTGCAILLDQMMRNLSCERLQCDELWDYICKKEKQVRPGDDPSFGDCWTYVAIDPATKLVPSFYTGKRTQETTDAFIADLKSRLSRRCQLTTDGLKMYAPAVAASFGVDGIDYATLVVEYASQEEGFTTAGKYSPPKIVGSKKTPVYGSPLEEHVGTSFVERSHLSLRMGCRRFGRLVNAKSKKLSNHGHAVAMWFAFYNLVRIHMTLRVTPAVEAGVTDHVWSLAELMKAAFEKADAAETALTVVNRGST